MRIRRLLKDSRLSSRDITVNEEPYDESKHGNFIVIDYEYEYDYKSCTSETEYVCTAKITKLKILAKAPDNQARLTEEELSRLNKIKWLCRELDHGFFKLNMDFGNNSVYLRKLHEIKALRKDLEKFILEAKQMHGEGDGE